MRLSFLYCYAIFLTFINNFSGDLFSPRTRLETFVPQQSPFHMMHRKCSIDLNLKDLQHIKFSHQIDEPSSKDIHFVQYHCSYHLTYIENVISMESEETATSKTIQEPFTRTSEI